MDQLVQRLQNCQGHPTPDLELNTSAAACRQVGCSCITVAVAFASPLSAGVSLTTCLPQLEATDNTPLAAVDMFSCTWYVSQCYCLITSDNSKVACWCRYLKCIRTSSQGLSGFPTYMSYQQEYEVPEDEDDTCELQLPSPLDLAELVSFTPAHHTAAAAAVIPAAATVAAAVRDGGGGGAAAALFFQHYQCWCCWLCSII
jgi:hypothetical protein